MGEAGRRSVTLLDVRKGSHVRIIEIPDERARAQCIRFGICEGTTVDSAEVITGGPVLLRTRNQEICLGRSLAGMIRVEGEAGPCDNARRPAQRPVRGGRPRPRWGSRRA